MNKAKSRTSLVLMELIITILFFSLASAVCVQLFVKAHLTTNKTRELNHALSITQSIAEVMNGTDGSIKTIKEFYKDVEGSSDYFVIYYDEDFVQTSDYDNATYAADVTVTHVGNLNNLDICFMRLKGYEEIYTLRSSKYIRRNFNN